MTNEQTAKNKAAKTTKSAPKATAKKATTKKATVKAAPVQPVEVNTEAKSEKVKIEIPAPLKIDAELFDSKLKALENKLSKDKAETTKNAFHVAYGYFLAKTNKGSIVVLEYHASLKKDKWIARNTQGELLTPEPQETLWKLHEHAVKNF